MGMEDGQIFYVLGMGRANQDYELMDETHIYAGPSPMTPERPLCKRGFNRYHGQAFSILRGNVGDLGVCPICSARQARGHTGIPWKRSRRLKKRIARASYSPLLPGLPLKPDYATKEEYEEAIWG